MSATETILFLFYAYIHKYKTYSLAKISTSVRASACSGLKATQAGRQGRGLTRQEGQQGRRANKSGGLKRQEGRQGRRAEKAGGPKSQVGRQGRRANKSGGLTRQEGQQVRWADKAGGPTSKEGWPGRRANKSGGLKSQYSRQGKRASQNFAAATYKTSMTKDGKFAGQSI
jgi:hypothetical protein